MSNRLHIAYISHRIFKRFISLELDFIGFRPILSVFYSKNRGQWIAQLNRIRNFHSPGNRPSRFLQKGYKSLKFDSCKKQCTQPFIIVDPSLAGDIIIIVSFGIFNVKGTYFYSLIQEHSAGIVKVDVILN